MTRIETANDNHFVLGPLNNSRSILCPVCGGSSDRDSCGMNHPIGVRVDQGVDVAEVTPGSVTITKQELDAYNSEGAIISLDFYCEWGHRFRIKFEFSHGSTSIKTERLEDFNPGTDSIDELWRWLGSEEQKNSEARHLARAALQREES